MELYNPTARLIESSGEARTVLQPPHETVDVAKIGGRPASDDESAFFEEALASMLLIRRDKTAIELLLAVSLADEPELVPEEIRST